MKLHTLQHGEQPLDLFIAEPTGPGPHPTVMICHAWSGRRAFEENKARALAELGYLAVAVDVYGVGQRGHDAASSRALMMGMVDNPDLFHERLTLIHAAVAGLPQVDAERVAVIGYCFGGMCALLMARLGLPLRAAVSFHGLLKFRALETRPQARMLVLHGQDDPMVPPQDVGAWAQEMQRIGGDWQLHAYPGVMHSFTNPAAADPSYALYDAQADARSWAAMQHFLREAFTSAAP